MKANAKEVALVGNRLDPLFQGLLLDIRQEKGIIATHPLQAQAEDQSFFEDILKLPTRSLSKKVVSTRMFHVLKALVGFGTE